MVSDAAVINEPCLPKHEPGKNRSWSSYTDLSQAMVDRLSKDEVVAESPNMRKIFNLVLRASWTDVTVLILGESGVGKEIVARTIHNTSSRAETGNFIQVNCGAIPSNLMEAELFGYAPGAFTGANPKGKAGMFEMADHGTMLLDEIVDLPLDMQVKLLRVLQEQQVYRVGSTKPIKLDVRIIAATNRDIWDHVQKGTFREDLYYRLNVLAIEVPPLRERIEDVEALANYFLDRFNAKYDDNKRLAPEALPLLKAYTWPGNVRELQNMIERLAVMTETEIIQADQVKAQLSKGISKVTTDSPIIVNKLIPIQEAKEILERELIIRAFQAYPSIRKAAEALGLDHASILRKAAKYGINRG